MSFVAGLAIGIILGAVGIVAFSMCWVSRHEDNKVSDIKSKTDEVEQLLAESKEDDSKNPFGEFNNKK